MRLKDTGQHYSPKNAEVKIIQKMCRRIILKAKNSYATKVPFYLSGLSGPASQILN